MASFLEPKILPPGCPHNLLALLVHYKYEYIFVFIRGAQSKDIKNIFLTKFFRLNLHIFCVYISLKNNFASHQLPMIFPTLAPLEWSKPEDGELEPMLGILTRGQCSHF